ncbi:MAG TPA: toll/interleukin-1 receptor domain-containing protein, partial [Tepidisphaeraceae bacterium]|nr:toll/interleukin-1 receptor domain-containing protein [Tepidisphaeraceae bacterium]
MNHDNKDHPPELFISYAHSDNAEGWITAFVEMIRKEFQAVCHRPLRVFFDKHVIQNMQDWERLILSGLKESKVMLAVLSPAYFASAYCSKEWRIFVQHEIARAMLDQGGIASLYYITVPGVLEGEAQEHLKKWISDINRRQLGDGCDARPWRDGGLEALQREDVRQRLRQLSQQIDHRIQLCDRVEKSPTTVPPYNPKFVGRVEDLRKLRHTLEENPVGALVGVQGIGGIGKTELAFAYAHAYADTYPGGRFLIPCAGISDLRDAIIRLAEHADGQFTLTLDQRKDLDVAAAAIRSQLMQRGRTLLLLDNVDQPALLDPTTRDRILPDRRHVHVLITTREDPRTLSDVVCVHVDALETQEALDLLEQHRPFA